MLKEIKILMVAPTPFFADRGCHMQIYEQARALQKRGHEVRIITYNIGRDLSDVVTIRIPNVAPWYKKLTAGPSLTKIWLDFFLIFTVWREAKKWEPDILHGHLHEGCFIGWIVSKLTGIPFLFDLQGSLVSEMVVHNFIKKGGIIYNIFFVFEKWLNKRAPVIMTHSTSRKKELEGVFKIPAEKIFTIFDGTNLNLFHPVRSLNKANLRITEKSESGFALQHDLKDDVSRTSNGVHPYSKNQDLIKKYNIPRDETFHDLRDRRLFGKVDAAKAASTGVEEERSDGLSAEASAKAEKTPDVEEKRRQNKGILMKRVSPSFVVYLGRLEPYQGVDLLIQSIPLVVKKNSSVHFLLFGYPDAEKYKEMAEKLGVGEYITFSGRIDYEKAGEHIALGDIAITLKLDVEDNGKLYNYMACGLPVIALDNFVNREVVSDFGFYVSESTTEAVSSAILKAVSTPKEVLQKMGEGGRRRIEKNFTWDKCAERMEKVYGKILNF